MSRVSEVTNLKETINYYLLDNGLIEDRSQVSVVAKATLRHLTQTEPTLKDWNFKQLDTKQKARLNEAVQHVLINGMTPWTPDLNIEKLSSHQKLVLNIIRGNSPKVKDLLKKEYFLSVVWKKNAEIFGETRELLNLLFADMVDQLNQKELSEAEAFHMEMIIGELLSLYPFISPEQGEKLSVPLKLDGKWQLINYQVDCIPLTPEWLGSPLMAFGLIPHNETSAPPLLLFKGTTYPTDDGFGLSLLTDINPFAPVGGYGFELGKEKISNWLNEHASSSKALIYGKSLGGALAWQAALSFTDKVERVMTYGAPGFSSHNLKECQKLVEQNKLPPIHMFCQKGDRVPVVDGVAAKGVHYYRVLGKHRRRGILAHADMFATHETSTILRLDPSREAKRWKRFGMTLLRQIASLVIFPLLIPFYGTNLAIDQTGKFLQKQIKRISLL